MLPDRHGDRLLGHIQTQDLYPAIRASLVTAADDRLSTARTKRLCSSLKKLWAPRTSTPELTSALWNALHRLSHLTERQGNDSRCVIASFGTTKVTLRLLLVFTEDGVAAGQVICTLSQPKLGVVEPIVMSFTFDAQGRTSFEVGADGDPVEMEQHGVEIVLHVLEVSTRPVDPEINPLAGAVGSQNANARL